MGLGESRKIGIRRIAALVVAATFAAGCCQLTTPKRIADIVKDPGAFDEREVVIRGKVTNVLKLPFMENRYFLLKDESGEILVITKGATPAIGSVLRVEGQVNRAVAIGENNYGVHVVEKKRC